MKGNLLAKNDSVYTIQSKKMLIINILDILRKYSDAEHRLSQKEIADILEKEYSMTADRKSIKRNLMDLIDFGYDISYTEIERAGKNGDAPIYTDWYLERDFSDAELRLLIDSVLFSESIPTGQCRDLIRKLKGLSNNYFSAKVEHVSNLPIDGPANPQLFFTVEILDDAISKKKQVSFVNTNFNYKKERVYAVRDDGERKRLVFNPYQMVATNGHYYLIGNYDYYDSLTYVRVDHIADIELLDTPVKPKKKVKGLEKGLDLPKHMAEHIYMFYGDVSTVTFRAPKYLSGNIIDWFGFDFDVISEDEENIVVKVSVSERAMKYWALQYGDYVEVLTPENLREEIRKTVAVMAERYGGGNARQV